MQLGSENEDERNPNMVTKGVIEYANLIIWNTLHSIRHKRGGMLRVVSRCHRFKCKEFIIILCMPTRLLTLYIHRGTKEFGTESYLQELCNPNDKHDTK